MTGAEAAAVSARVADGPAAPPSPTPSDAPLALAAQRAVLEELAEWREQQQRQWTIGFVATCLLAVWLVSHLDRLNRHLAYGPRH